MKIAVPVCQYGIHIRFERTQPGGVRAFRPCIFNVPITGSRTLSIGSLAAPVRWTSFGNDATGVFFLLTGEFRRSYLIETSSDLVKWQALQTISTDGSGQYLLRPDNTRTTSDRFYRARIP